MIWLVGNKGMLGQAVAEALQQKQIYYLGTDREVDITDPRAIAQFLEESVSGTLEGIINCSAYTAVDQAEDEEDKAFLINRDGVINLARAAEKKCAFLLHISTDYVFRGDKQGAYEESSPTDPAGAYGRSKLAGEQEILKLCTRHYIIRTAWLYGKYNKNFVYTMLNLFKQKDTVSVVADQWGTPTYTRDLANIIVRFVQYDDLVREPEYGIYHYTNHGRTNWHQFALEIYRKAREMGIVDRDVTIKPITTAEYPTKALRPANSYLSKEKIKGLLKIVVPDWEDSLEKFLLEVKEEL